MKEKTCGERIINMTDGNRRTTSAPLVACRYVTSGQRIYLSAALAQQAATRGAVVILMEGHTNE